MIESVVEVQGLPPDLKYRLRWCFPVSRWRQGAIHRHNVEVEAPGQVMANDGQVMANHQDNQQYPTIMWDT